MPGSDFIWEVPWEGEENMEGRRRENERLAVGREKGCETRWYLPPVEVRVIRKRRPELVDARYV